MFIPSRCPHLGAHLQLFPWQKQPHTHTQDAVAKQPQEAEGCTAALTQGSPVNLHREETLGNCSSPFVSQSCPKGPSHHAAAPSEAVPEFCKGKHSTFRNSFLQINLPRGETCFLQVYTDKVLFALAKIFGGSGG